MSYLEGAFIILVVLPAMSYVFVKLSSNINESDRIIRRGY